VRQYREEGIVARRHEIRRIRQARLFWQGMQYAWWNPNDMNWHLPFEQRSSDDRALEEMPRYQFVTNFYQGFGLSFIAVLSQNVPEALEIPLGEDVYVCPHCHKETPAQSPLDSSGDVILSGSEGPQRRHNRGSSDVEILQDANDASLRMTPPPCSSCGAELNDA